MAKFLTHVISNGTKVAMNVPGNTVDNIMKKLRRNRLQCVRNADIYLFYNKKTGILVDSRFN
jgi:protein tyrosine phosphatase